MRAVIGENLYYVYVKQILNSAALFFRVTEFYYTLYYLYLYICMTLPTDFSPWEHLQSTLMNYQNRVVREEFNDLSDVDATWDEDINISRGSLRVACTLKDDDTATMTELRLWLFYGIMRKASDFHPPIYGIPTNVFQESIAFVPQITLYFSQDIQGVPDNERPVEAYINFRVKNETTETITEAKARSLAAEIRSVFGASNGYRWRKGKVLSTYTRKDQGYKLCIYGFNETEGREVISKILSINEHVIDNDYLTVHIPERNNAATPGNQLIYGKQRKKYRWRPNAYVRFRYAALKIHGLPNDVILYDNSGRWRNPLLKEI